jgi:hypothetical protein
MTREGTFKSYDDGGRSYSYNTANPSNIVTAKFLSLYPSKETD